MARWNENLFTLSMWPIAATTFAMDLGETVLGARQVIDTRLPMIRAAWADPLRTDVVEMGRMVSEKVDAFGTSHQTLRAASERIRSATQANAKALGRLSGGGVLWPSDWFEIAERNLEIFTTLAALPAAVLKPVQSKVKANARRLRIPQA